MTVGELNQRGQCGIYCPECGADLGDETPSTDPEHDVAEVDCPACGEAPAVSELGYNRTLGEDAVWGIVDGVRAQLAESRRQVEALQSELLRLRSDLGRVKAQHDEVTDVAAEVTVGADLEFERIAQMLRDHFPTKEAFIAFIDSGEIEASDEVTRGR